MHPVVRPALALFAVMALAGHVFAQDRPRVELSGIERGPLLEEVPLNGTVTALRRSDISVAVAGLVLAHRVDVGDRVKAGEELLALDGELTELALQQAQAQLRQADSVLAEARRVFEEARSVGAGTNIAATEVNRRQSDVAGAEARRASAEAAVALEQARLRRHRLQAPFAGVISSRSADAGQWVQPGTPVFTLVDTDSLVMEFQVPQHVFSYLNDSTELRISAYGRPASQATILNWVPVNSGDARTFLLRAQTGEDQRLNPGMSVDGTLTVQRGSEVLSVPRDALNRYPDGRITVWLAAANDDGGVYTVTEQRVSLAGTAGDRAFIGSGLAGDERVVSRGNESLREGIEVERADGGTGKREAH